MPALGACKDDVRSCVRDLLTRTKIGDTVMKKQALIGLYEVLNEDDKYVRIVVEVGGIVNVLVGGFLDFSEVAEIQEEPVKAVLAIVRFDWCKRVLVENVDNAWSVSTHGGVTALLKVCANGKSKAELICLARGLLRNHVPPEEIKRSTVEEGVVSRFIKLSQLKVDNVQISAIEFLQNIASEDDSIRQKALEI
ncbi:hypothetical protein NL676_012354 [Syzygium grande]|nr:hypothetical protein NL676_012354 [Syzygium grande]